ncbi:MAG: type II secretion system protein [Verrucomicrobiota bacterium]
MKPRLSNRKTAALTLMEVLVIIAVLAVVVAVFLPEFAPAKKRTTKIDCVNNLKQISLAFRIWSVDNGDKYPMEVPVTNGGAMEFAALGNAVAIFQVISNELSTPKVLICPSDTKRRYATNFSGALSTNNISYFVGLDANTDSPKTFLSGDRNIVILGGIMKNGVIEITTKNPVGWSSELHGGFGNIAFPDGTVHRTESRGTSWNLRDLIRKTGLATNRLAIP